MISFRYHVFTIVAIFLAVALGIAVGNAYVQPALVRSLQRQTEGLRTHLHDLEAKYTQLQGEVGQLARAGDILPVVDGRELAGRPVIIVTQDGSDPELLSSARDALDEAQADVVAVLSVTDRLALRDGQPHTDLAKIVGLPAGAASDQVVAAAAERLAQRLAAGSPRRGAHPGGDDILDELLRGQYVAVPRGAPSVSEADLSQIGGQGEIVVALAGGAQPSSVPPDVFMIPFVRALIAHGATVAAGDTASTVDPFVDILRDDADLDGTQLVTVDDLGWPIGGAALVLGLERSLTVGQGGDYGIRDGAEAPIPPIP